MIYIVRQTRYWLRRQKIAYLFVIVGLGYIGSFLVSTLVLTAADKVLCDMSFAVVSVLLLLFVLYFGNKLLVHERKQGTYQLLRMQQISSFQYVCSKVISMLCVMTVLLIGCVMLQRLLFWAADTMYIVSLSLYRRSIIFLWIKVAIVLGIIVLFRTFLSPIIAIITTLVCYLRFHSAEIMLYTAQQYTTSSFGQYVLHGLYVIAPNFAILDVGYYLFTSVPDLLLSQRFLWQTFGIHLLYVIALFLLSTLLFSYFSQK